MVDNSRGGEDRLAGAPARVVRADAVRSSYHARNRGAADARGEWLLFLDADCRPDPRLIDEYLGSPRAESCGAVAGAVLPAPGQEGLLTRYARSRGYLDQRAFMSGPGRPFAATANLLVRRAAWEQLGGFSEVRSAGDVDFCWRLQDAGWSLELEEAAWVEHRHRDTLGALLRQRARYAAGHRWLERRHPAVRSRVPLHRALARAGLELLASARRRDTEEVRFRALDILALLAYAAGRLASNEPRGAAAGDPAAAGRHFLREVIRQGAHLPDQFREAVQDGDATGVTRTTQRRRAR